MRLRVNRFAVCFKSGHCAELKDDKFHPPGLFPHQREKVSNHCLLWLIVLLASTVTGIGAQQQAATAAPGAYCQFSKEDLAEKKRLRLAALEGDDRDRDRYQAIVKKHADQLKACRRKNWPQTQAIWLRLYPCDIKPGMLETTLDRIVSRGYNQVNVEVFHNGQVLLPASQNSTPWPSLVQSPGKEQVDLLRMAITKGRERGLTVYAWMFTMNFGRVYSQRSGRDAALARNGKGESSYNKEASQAFIDPYHPTAQNDYQQLLRAVLRRDPDGVLFDYIRYPRGTGTESIATRVQDLWIYGQAAQQVLLRRAQNYKGQTLIQRFLSKGYITASDLEEVNSLYPQEGEPLWQGRTSIRVPPEQQQALLQAELWRLSVSHALQGVLDFLKLALRPVQQQGLPSGVVFFPGGNRAIGKGFDSRLQPWDRFPAWTEWHPMAYASCGRTNCIIEQVRRVLRQAPRGTRVKPALAGTWGQSIRNRPSLERQMQALYQAAPRIQTVSHFAYSWQEPSRDRDRKYCRL